MAADQGVTDWIDLSDFSQGIQSAYRSTVRGGPDGAAQIADTWGCVANPQGGLEAAPRLTVTSSGVFNSGDAAPVSGTLPTGVRVHDMLAVSSWKNPNWADYGQLVLDQADTIVTQTENWSSSGGFDVQKPRTSLLTPNGALHKNMWSSLPGYAPNHRHWGSGSVAVARSRIGKNTKPAPSGSFANTAPSNAADFSDPPYFSIPVASWGRVTQNTFPNSVWTSDTYLWGDPTDSNFAPSTSNVLKYPGVTSTGVRMFTHQGRLAFTQQVGGFGAWGVGLTVDYGETLAHNSAQSVYGYSTLADDLIGYSYQGDIQDWDLTDQFQIDSRVPDMTGVVASMNMNDLFIVKAQRGGVIVRGAMQQPQVITVPGVVPTGPYPHYPVVTPRGLVYGTPYGVFAWNGGDTSEQLSPGLEGPFWVAPGNTIFERHPRTPVGRFAFQFPYLFAPYNWVMDMRTGGWFRLHPTAAQDATRGRDLSLFTTGLFNKVYAMQQVIPASGAGSNELVSIFDVNAGAPRFSWRSQPLARTKNRRLQFREVALVANGSGTVTVSLIGLNSTKSVTFTVASSKPTIYRQPISVDAHDVEVKIVSDGGVSDVVDAPSVLRLSLGFHSTTTV